jgi:hypothetical protein
MKKVLVDLKEFFLNYAETIPLLTVFECTIIETYNNGLSRLNLQYPNGLTFQQKAYDLFRVIEKDDATIDILMVIT